MRLLLCVYYYFIIHAQKYHPDKKNVADITVYSKTMSMLNLVISYDNTKSMENAEPAAVETKGDKLYKYVAKEVINCQPAESFAIYFQPENVKGWKKLFELELVYNSKTAQSFCTLAVHDTGVVHI